MQTATSQNSAQKRVKAVKSIKFMYSASGEISSLFETFRLMVNDAIRIALNEKARSRFNLSSLAYPRLKEYGLNSYYILSAIEVAYSVFRNKNRKSVPYISKGFLKLGSAAYRLNHLLLRIPVTPRRYIFLILQGSDYHLSLIDDQNLKRGSITITERAVSISFSKEMKILEPTGYLGLDINERNVTVSATSDYDHRYNELAEVVEIKENYREIRARIGRRTRQDRRIGGQLHAKYGKRESNRTAQRIHKATKQITGYAKGNQYGIKMEKLAGIRKLYRKRNTQGTLYRGRMNTWVFGEVQRQIGYKAAWLGVPAYYVNPRGTSRNCPDCGSRVAPLQDRKLYCPKCDKTWDRDDLASKNIMACAVPQARPTKGSDEKERGEVGSNPLSRWEEVKPAGDFEPASQQNPPSS